MNGRQQTTRWLAIWCSALLTLSLVGCAPSSDDPAEILRAGACDRLRILHNTALTMGDSAARDDDGRDPLIEIAVRRIEEEAEPGPELTRSHYGDDLHAFRDQVELAIYSENARVQGAPGGPDWRAIAEAGGVHADDWGCGFASTLPHP